MHPMERMTSSDSDQLHLFFFPHLAHGHMIPMIDMAVLFAERGLKVSIITTPLNATLHQKIIYQAKEVGHQIQFLLLHIPYSEVGLPRGCEILDSSNASVAFIATLMKAVGMLVSPFEQLVREYLPDCIVSDAFLPWTLDIASKFDIPRLTFNGTCFFSICLSRTLRRYKPHEKVASDTETFVVPALPHKIVLTRSQMPDFDKLQNDFAEFMSRVLESDSRSYGVLMNSFYELETIYIEYFKEISPKVWHIGPVSLRNRNTLGMSERGKRASIDVSKCLSWLDAQEPKSVIYLCFGSICKLSTPQMLEIALAIEASNLPFIWVIRDENSDTPLKWLADGMEERMKEKGLIINGWAPQILILNHPSVGTFVTHCGWNSILEGVTAGLPMITWPMFAEQFYNEKLVTDVLKIGVGVGSKTWISFTEKNTLLVKSEEINKALTRVMGDGEESQGFSKRARKLGEMAKTAIGEGGSSHVDMSRLIDELRNRSAKKE